VDKKSCDIKMAGLSTYDLLAFDKKYDRDYTAIAFND